MIKNVDVLAKFVKGGADVLQKAIDSKEEVSLELIEGSFVSENDLNQLKESRFNDGKKEGQTIGYDFALKDIKKDFAIELEGKDRAKIIEAIQTKIITDAKIEPNKKIDEYKNSLENLQKKYETDLSSKEKETADLANKIKEYKVNSDLSKHLPENLKGIDSNDFLTLARMNATFDYEGDTLVVKKGETILKDKLEKPISPKDYLTDFAIQKNWIVSDGRGGGDDKGSGANKFNSMHDVFKFMEQNKINPVSPEGLKLQEEFKNNLNK